MANYSSNEIVNILLTYFANATEITDMLPIIIHTES